MNFADESSEIFCLSFLEIRHKTFLTESWLAFSLLLVELFTKKKFFFCRIQSDPVFNFWKHLCKLQGYLFAPRIPKAEVQTVAFLYEENLEMFKALFSNVQRIPKQHFGVHYERVIFLETLVNEFCVKKKI